MTLTFMIVGGTFAAATFNTWQWLPALEPFAFQRFFGWLPGLAVQLFLLFVLYKGLVYYERKHTGQVNRLVERKVLTMSFHPFLLAGLTLAVLNASLLFFTGSPWSISSVFPFWGSQLIEWLQLPIDWPFWDYTQQNETRMNASLFTNPVSLTTFGVISGAFLVSLRRPRSKIQISSNGLIMSLFGGTIMGIGAVMASGCNIGAFFSGIASGSLHGWVWFIFALLGNWAGLKVRIKMLQA